MPRPPFPRDVRQFQREFATDAACQQYLAACRWPDGFRCPRCGHTRGYAMVNHRRWKCAACRYQASLTAGTILHNTKTPLTLWFWAAYLMTTDTRGISALVLQRQLGLRRYQTAWMLLHKLRRAMVNLAREPLHGEIEADDTWIGGPQPGLRGSRQLKGRHAVPVLVMVEKRHGKRGDRSGRVRMGVLRDFKATTVTALMQQHIAPGATVYTDGLGSFAGLPKASFTHVARPQPSRVAFRKGATSVVPLADRAIGNLQQWLIGTYHGVSRAQLQAYLDEFVFRHNRRQTPMAAFQTLLGLGAGHPPTPYRRIKGGRDMVERLESG
jgi:transposase-like protein